MQQVTKLAAQISFVAANIKHDHEVPSLRVNCRLHAGSHSGPSAAVT
jgi:hypothetical protein